jgi:hypothetical protein
MSKYRKSSSARPAIIRIISSRSDLSSGDGAHEAAMTGELVNAGMLDGEEIRDESGRIVGAIVTGPTIKGRLLALDLLRQEREQSWWYRSIKYLMLLVGYIFGLLSPLLTEWLRGLLRLTPGP